MFREAARIVEDGVATPEQVDEIVRSSFGFRLPFFGPFTIADMRYHGQGYEIPVSIDPAEIRSVGVADLEERFNGLHEQLYG